MGLKIFDDIIESSRKAQEEEAKALGISVDELLSRREAEQKKRDDEYIRLCELKAEEYRKSELAYGEKTGLTGIPCAPAYIVRVRMLHERGMGTGASKPTRNHLRLKADCTIGKIKRVYGELLCGAKARFDTQECDFSAEIDCPRCLAILKRAK